MYLLWSLVISLVVGFVGGFVSVDEPCDCEVL